MGWVAFEGKTMGGLGQDAIAHGLTFIDPAQPIRSSGLLLVKLFSPPLSFIFDQIYSNQIS
jgi:hypothetical protein